MPECINHPGKEGVYRCARCRKYFCLACVELIDDKAYCFDCLKEIVKESREGTKKSLTMRVGVSSLIAIMIAIVSIHNSLPLLMYIYRNSTGIYAPPSSALAINALYLVIGLAFLVLSFGLAVTKRWAYRYGIVVSVVTFIVELVKVINSTGGLGLVFSTPQSDAAALFIIMTMGSLMLFLAIISSRKELMGW